MAQLVQSVCSSPGRVLAQDGKNLCKLGGGYAACAAAGVMRERMERMAKEMASGSWGERGSELRKGDSVVREEVEVLSWEG